MKELVARSPLRHQQRGVVLLIALVMLVAMTLVGISMLRSIGAGAGIAGNLAFKQNATSATDVGVEVARAWLLNTGVAAPLTLQSNVLASGYYACWYEDCSAKTEFNPLTHDWTSSKKLTSSEVASISSLTGRDDTGNEIRYVVHRLCDLTGDILVENNAGQKCANYTDYSGLSSKGGTGYGQSTPSLTDQPFFRVTVRVAGPRNTLSYTQVVMY